MIYEIIKSTRFKKDFEKCVKRGLSEDKFEEIITYLRNGDTIPERYKDHPLKPSRNYVDCRELHIESDWLLIYKYIDEAVVLYLVRTGSHSDLF